VQTIGNLCAFCALGFHFFIIPQYFFQAAPQRKFGLHNVVRYFCQHYQGIRLPTKKTPGRSHFTGRAATAANAQLDQFPRPINVVYKKFICYIEKYLINTAYFMHNSSAQRGFPLHGCPSCRICTVHIIGILASSGVYTVPVPIDFQVGQYRLEHWRPFSAGQYIFAEGNSRHSRQRSACRRGAPAKNRLQCAF
jgi:hypothetical protein